MSCLLDVYVNSISGDCQNTNSGAFELVISGDSPGFTITWLNPTFSPTYYPSSTNVIFSGLSSDTYSFFVTDSCFSGGVSSGLINVYISSGTCAQIINHQNTTCGNVNGSLTAQTQFAYGEFLYSLYNVNSGLTLSLISASNQQAFNNLIPGTYYVVVNDGGGCTGKTESCIIKSSATFDFGFYVINSTNCGVDTGSVYVTGLTGNPPYTYNWSNGSNNSYLSGLTSGIYSVQIIDATGCILSKSAIVTDVPNVEIVSFISTSPNCFSGNGEITVYITGGTAPYYFSGSNGYSEITFSNSCNFTGLSDGFFSVSVTDAGLCSDTDSTNLLTANSFYGVTTSVTNSICNNSNGSVDIFVIGPSGFYTYSLIDSSGNTQSVTIIGNNNTFIGLSSGNYTLQITNGGPCVYTQSITISNTNLFTLSTTTTGTTCNNEDGSVTLTISSGGTPPYLYDIGIQSDTSSSLSYTFYNLASGNYTASVSDSNFCQQILPFTISTSNSVDFNLNVISPTIGPNGQINAFITNGEPPFSWIWSSNVPSGQTGLTITGLSAASYTLSVTDNNGCVRTRSVKMFGYNLVSSYEILSLCEDISSFTGEIGKRGPQQMLVEGFFDLTSGDTGCILNQAIFEVVVSGDSVVKTNTFFTGTSFNDFPTDDEYYTALSDTLLQYDGIQTVDISPLDNQIIINTICDPPVSLIDLQITANLKIYYDISCISCTP
jgi:large repetitive protein